jgi:hypothetical protein
MIRNRFVAYRPPEAGVPVSSGDAPRSQNNLHDWLLLACRGSQGAGPEMEIMAALNDLLAAE